MLPHQLAVPFVILAIDDEPQGLICGLIVSLLNSHQCSSILMNYFYHGSFMQVTDSVLHPDLQRINGEHIKFI